MSVYVDVCMFVCVYVSVCVGECVCIQRKCMGPQQFKGFIVEKHFTNLIWLSFIKNIKKKTLHELAFVVNSCKVKFMRCSG